MPFLNGRLTVGEGLECSTEVMLYRGNALLRKTERCFFCIGGLQRGLHYYCVINAVVQCKQGFRVWRW